ncbi:MAG: SLBB domain-containing protein [Bacteroidia bacterium]|nr:SLBB domain-containing protein [Bacteroidia bacterium]
MNIIALTMALFLGAIVAPSDAQAQDPKNVNVSELSDAQINKVISEMNSRNLSLEQAKQLARARGASEVQIAEMEKRILNAKPNGDKTNNKTKVVTVEPEEASERAVENNTISKEDALVFGHSLFNNSKLSFEPNVNAPVSDTYVLGPGDEVNIDIFGLSQQSYTTVVARTGNIDIPLIGPIYVGGQSFASARQIIMSKLRTIYSDLGGKTSASIKLGKLRTINVSVMGEVFAPGTYTVLGTTSLFNLMHLSGGPTSNGSFRDVQLLRDGKVVAHLDVYDFLIKGNASVNVALRDGDIVMVPTYQKRIIVEGAFKRTGYFEAKEGETSDDIIAFAGGFTPQAYTENIQYTHITTKGLEFMSIKAGDAIPMSNGDKLVVNDISENRLNGQVSINGAVFAPGKYQFKEGIKLSELVEMAGGLVENVFLSRGIITRLKEDRSLESLNFNVADLVNGSYNIELKDQDDIFITTKEELRARRNITIIGEVLNPQTIEYRENITLGDVIVLAGGLTEIACPSKIDICRRLSDEESESSPTISSKSTTVTITKDLSIGSKDNEFVLMPYDVISVHAYPNSRIRGAVKVSGMVNFPGTYSILSTEETITSLIERAGGFSSLADIEGARLYRRVAIDDKMKNILKDRVSSLDNDEVTTEVDTEDHYELVAIELSDILSNPGKYSNIHVRANDELVIPQKQETVSVSGHVLNSVSLSYIDGLNAKKYVQLAGGFAPNAYKSKLYVIYPNGKAKATKRFLWFKNYPKVVPGSQVVVPEKVKKERIGAPALISMSSSVVAMIAIVVNLLDKD